MTAPLKSCTLDGRRQWEPYKNYNHEFFDFLLKHSQLDSLTCTRSPTERV